ncbi:MAG: hypothetical protein KC503_46520 [Myxococcales bacterium]|nr:hypothetical protein [Myxococcales bacterium]
MTSYDTHADVVAARAEGAMVMVPLGEDAPWPDAATVEASDCYPPPVQLADGRWVGTRTILSEARRELVVLHGAERSALALPYEWEPHSNVRIALAGQRALLVARFEGRGHVVERRLDGSDEWAVIASAHREGRASHQYGESANIWGADYLASDDHVTLVVAEGTKKHLALLWRGDDGWQEIDRLPVKGLDPVSKGRVVVVRHPKGVESFGLLGAGADAQLAKLGKLAHLFFFAHPADTRAQLFGHRGVGKDGHLLVCEEAALAKKKPRRR